MKIDDLLLNPWDNVYWFSRMLISSDEYGGIGTDSKTMLAVSSAIKTVLAAHAGEDDEETIQILSETVRNVFLHGRREGTAKYRQLQKLCDDIYSRVTSVHDYQVFGFTCEKVMVPINQALNQIPNDDKIFVESIANAILEQQGVKGLANLINILDGIGSKGCLTVEREQIVEAFGKLKDHLKIRLNEKETDIVLTAFCQEFERRVGQKRKGRAGRSVEDITGLILNYFDIKTTQPPEHFTTGLEIDKWIRTKDRWIIGISCKRTLRERWKQAYTTDVDLLNRHKIRELWHVITYDKDLSDDKITEIGSHKAILYLPDNSPRLKHALKHPGMKDYVRPITRLISDLKALTGQE